VIRDVPFLKNFPADMDVSLPPNRKQFLVQRFSAGRGITGIVPGGAAFRSRSPGYGVMTVILGSSEKPHDVPEHIIPDLGEIIGRSYITLYSLLKRYILYKA
jgi:hypothetical protein